VKTKVLVTSQCLYAKVEAEMEGDWCTLQVNHKSAVGSIPESYYSDACNQMKQTVLLWFDDARWQKLLAAPERAVPQAAAKTEQSALVGG
jgi:hypothetical protein